MTILGDDAVQDAGDASDSARLDPSARRAEAERVRLRADQALYFYGVARTRGWRGSRGSIMEGDVMRVRYRDLEALVRPVSYDLPTLDQENLLAHQRVLESAMRHGTVLPAPYGIVFRGRRQLIRMLQDQYVAIDEGLSFLDGHWELRLHIGAREAGEVDPVLTDLAMQMYTELRRHARAAVPFASDHDRLVSAAFLVERNAWVEFVERADDLGSAHPELVFDVTGPWPGYDFVRVTP